MHLSDFSYGTIHSHNYFKVKNTILIKTKNKKNVETAHVIFFFLLMHYLFLNTMHCPSSAHWIHYYVNEHTSDCIVHY